MTSQNKQTAGKYLNTDEIAIEELKEKYLNENKNKSTKFWLKVRQDWAIGESI
jgi:hypothetical protein